MQCLEKLPKADLGLLQLVGHAILWRHQFFLDFHPDVDGLRIDTEVTSLSDISFQNHNDVVAIT